MTTTHKESTSLFIGNQQSSAQVPLFLRSNPEGISYFNSWDSGLTSLETSNTERFESKFANQILGHSYNCTSIKVLDDIAAVAYGNYTDLNKTVYQDTSGGIYRIWYNTSSSYYGGPYDQTFSFDFALPILNKNFPEISDVYGSLNSSDVDFSNLFILIEYDGYFTGDSGNLETRNLSKGRYELFKYQDPNISVPTQGTFYFNSLLKCVLLSSKYSVNTYCNELTPTGTISSSRLAQTHVTNDRINLADATSEFGASEFAYGFIGYNKVSLIKYTPVVECGKVDIYYRKSGTISSELDSGKVQSSYHGLKNGDIIKISGARNSYGKNPDLNGLKYIQVNTTNIFSLYEDSEMTIKTPTVNGVSPDAKWICVGNVYSENLPDGWGYKQTIFSPTGRNGYTLKTAPDESLVTHESENTTPISADFSQDETMYDIAVRDLGYTIESDEISVLDESVVYGPLGSLIPVRKYPSPLDYLWSNPDNYITGYQFGCDIDFKYINGNYYLLVGERGINSHCLYDLHSVKILPANNPSGKVHLFEIEVTAAKNVTYTYAETFYASSGDSSILRADDISENTYRYVNFYNGTQNAVSTALNSSEQQIVLEKLVSTDKFLKNDYWFGAYLFHFDIISETNNHADYSLNGAFPYTSAYFSNFSPIDLTFENNGISNYLDSVDMYPYCDSFGKSVCLASSGTSLLIIASSKNKIRLYPNTYEYDETDNAITDRRKISYIPSNYGTYYSATDCGYVHCIKYTSGSSTKINKLYHSGVETISGGIDPQYLRAEKFAKTIKELNGFIYFGCSKPEEFYDIYKSRVDPYVIVDGEVNINNFSAESSTTTVFQNESSRIYCYKYNQSSSIYSLVETIRNELNNNHYYNISTNSVSMLAPNQKELTLQNKKYNNRRIYRHITYSYDNILFFPSDRFGDYFDINKELLVTNSLDIISELGVTHNDIVAGPDLSCDYVHIYERILGFWGLASKLSASIDIVDSRYSYEDLYDNGSNCINSLRGLGNYNFSNSSNSSKTWDIDLTNSFVLADDRIILKDPFGYSVFRKDPGTTRSIQAPPTQDAENTSVYPYFKFDEHFNAMYNKGNFEELCNFSHTKYGSMYEYNTDSYVINRFNPGGLDLQLNTPVYFFSLPSNYVRFGASLNVSVKVGVFDGDDSAMKLKLHIKDPRINLEADYVDNFSYSCSQDGSYLLYSDTDPDGELVYSKGCLSVDDSIIISPTSITDSDSNNYKIYEFNIPQSILNVYVLSDNQLKNSTITSNSESLVLNDTSQDTYNATISVIKTLIMSFNFGNLPYSTPQFDETQMFQIQSIDVELNIPSVDSSSSTAQYGNYSSNSYACVYNKVVNYSYNTILNNCESGTRIYTNPIIGIGVSNSDSYNVYESGLHNGDMADSYQIISIDKYNTFESDNKVSGDDLIVMRSLDIQPLTYLPLFMSTSTTASGTMNLFTSQSSYLEDEMNLYVSASIGLNNSINLFVGPSTYVIDAPLYIRSLGLAPDPASGDADRSLNLSIPSVTRIFGVDSLSATYLHIETPDLDSGVDLIVQGPKSISGTKNLSIWGRSILATYQDNSPSLFINGLYVSDSTISLDIRGLTPGLVNLVISGPISIQTEIPLVMYSHSQDYDGAATLVMFEYPKTEMPLYISSPELVSDGINLFTQYDLRYANSIDNAASNSCGAYINELPFDVTTVVAESLINGSNSIAEPNYSIGNTFGYEPNQIAISDIDTDYKFYRYGRFQKVTDTNGSILAIGIKENNSPKLLLFAVSGDETTFIIKIDDYSGFTTSSQHLGNCSVMDVKVSENGLSAISSYLEILNSADQFVRGYFIISIYDANGSLVKEWRRSFTDSSNDAFMSNHMGMTLCWNDEDILYTKEVGVLGTIQKRMGPYYNTESLVLDSSKIPSYSTLYDNWSNNMVPYYRMAFGHRIEITTGDRLYITAPLISYKTLSALSTPDNLVFTGAVYDFEWSGSEYVYDNSYIPALTSDRLYGYDMCGVDQNGFFSISEPVTKIIVRLNSSLIYQNDVQSSDTNFGMSIDNCHDAVYTIVNDSLYNVNTSQSLSFPATNAEITPYIPAGNIILNSQEKIRTPIISGGKTFVVREFSVTYGFGSTITFRKLSLLKQSRKFDTPSLFIMNQGLGISTDLYLETVRILDSGADLTIEGMYTHEGVASLFVRHLPDNMGDDVLALRMKALDPTELSEVVGLSVYGSVLANTFSLSNVSYLHCSGGIAEYSEGINLRIDAPSTGSVNSEDKNLLPLFMNIPSGNNSIVGVGYAVIGSTFQIGSEDSESANLGIYLMNTQTSGGNALTGSTTTTLILNSTYGDSEGLSLWMIRRGPGGGEEYEGIAPLVLENKNSGSDVNLYTNAVYGAGNNTTLVFTPSSGLTSKDVKIQIFGYRE